MRRPAAVAAFGFVATLVGTTWLKAVAASRRELWLDETHSSLIAGMSLEKGLSFLRGDQYPPLYYLLLKLWTSVFTDSPESLRWSSILMSVAGALAAFVMGRRVLGGRAEGGACAALFLISPALFAFSIEIRAYMLAVIFLMLATALWFDLRDGETCSSARTVAFGVTCAAAFYTHYLAAIPIVVLFGFLLLEDSRARYRGLLSLGVLVALAYPWAREMPGQVAASHELRVARESARMNPESLNYDPRGGLILSARLQKLAASEASLLGLYPVPSVPGLLALAAPFLLFLWAAARMALRGDRPSLLFLAVTLTLLVTLVFLRLESRRYLVVSAPFLVLAAGQAVLQAWRDSRPRLRAGLIGLGIPLIWLAGTLRVAAERPAQPVREIVSTLAHEVGEGDRVVFNATWSQVPFEYTARHLGVDLSAQLVGFPVPIREWWDHQESKEWGGPVILRRDLQRFVDVLLEPGPRRVWVVAHDLEYYDPRNQLLRELEGRSARAVEYPLRESRNSEEYRLYRVDFAPVPIGERTPSE